jgi:hypothetical protein
LATQTMSVITVRVVETAGLLGIEDPDRPQPG